MQRLRHNLFIATLITALGLGTVALTPNSLTLVEYAIVGLFILWLVFDAKTYSDTIDCIQAQSNLYDTPIKVQYFYLVERILLTLVFFGIFGWFVTNFVASSGTTTDYCLLFLGILFLIFPIMVWVCYFTLGRTYARQWAETQQTYTKEEPTAHHVVAPTEEGDNIYRFK